MKWFLMKSFLAILALSPFFTLKTAGEELTACQELAENAGDDAGAFISFLFDHVTNNEDYCTARLYADEESPAEVYSDAIIYQSWHYCVKTFGETKKGKKKDWQRLGLTNNSVEGLEGKDLWPYNRKAGTGKRFAKNRAARRVAKKCGKFRFVGTFFSSLVGLVTFGDNYGGTKRREAVNQFFEDTTSGESMNQFDALVNAFKEGFSHPSKVLSTGACKRMMDKCSIPADIQKEYIAEAVALSAVGDPDE